MARVRIGDVVEFKGEKGRYFAHYVHRHPSWGPLMWFFGEPWFAVPDDLARAVGGTPVLIAFFSLSRSVNLGLVTVVGNTPVPPERRRIPQFKDGVTDPKTGSVENWWLWDGDREWLVGKLSPDQDQLPIRQIVNAAYFVELAEAP